MAAFARATLAANATGFHNRVVDWTRGYPYFLQEFGKHAWDTAAGPDEIRAGDVEVATPLAIAELDAGFFRVRMDRATGAERTYLAAMASMGAGPYACGEVASVLDKTSAEVAPLHDALVRRGLCYTPRDGVIDYTVPMFDEFVRRALT